MLQIAFYQPDIPQNIGAAMRLCACMNTVFDIIEPCGFPWNEKKIRQSAMDYYDHITIKRHSSWQKFVEKYETQKRIILLTTKTEQSFIDFEFQNNDILLFGSESAGVPEEIHKSVENRLTIPMPGQLRSLNIVNSASIVLSEAMRQTGAYVK